MLELQGQVETKARILFVTPAVVFVKVNIACPAAFVLMTAPGGAGVPPPITVNCTG